MSKRIDWADAFRGFLMLLIVYGHTASNGDALKHYVYSFHVAAFFFLSGFLFSKGGLSFRDFAKKKFCSLMIPYYLFGLLSIVIFTFLGAFASEELDVAIKHTEIHKNLLGLVYANAVEGYMKWNLPLWFLPCMFVTQLLYYPVSHLTDALIKRQKYGIVFAVGLSLVLPYLDYFVFRVRALPMHLESSVFLMPFFILGAAFRRENKAFYLTDIRQYKKLAAALFLLTAGSLTGLFLNCRVNYFLSSYGKITVFYLSAFLSVIGLYMLFPLVRSKALSLIGQNTLAVLVMHKFPVVFFQIALSPLLKADGVLHMASAALVASLSVGLCLLAGRIIEKFAPFALGKSRLSARDHS